MTMEEIVGMYENLIYKIANRFYNIPKEDLVQAGNVGLIKAYQNYKNNGVTKFSTYAYEYIFGEMYQMVYKNQNLKVSRDTLKLYQKIEMTRSSLAQHLARVPSNQEVAKFLKLSSIVVDQVIIAGTCIMKSFDENSENDERSLYETVGESKSISLEEQLTLQESIKELNLEEQQIIQYRYFNDFTQSEIAKKMNMTQVMVSRYEKKGITKMRQYYDIAS